MHRQHDDGLSTDYKNPKIKKEQLCRLLEDCEAHSASTSSSSSSGSAPPAVPTEVEVTELPGATVLATTCTDVAVSDPLKLDQSEQQSPAQTLDVGVITTRVKELYSKDGPWGVAEALAGIIRQDDVRRFFDEMMPAASLAPHVPASCLRLSEEKSTEEKSTMKLEVATPSEEDLLATFTNIKGLLDTRFGVQVPDTVQETESMLAADGLQSYLSACSHTVQGLQDFAFTLLMVAAAPWARALQRWEFPLSQSWASNVTSGYDDKKRALVVTIGDIVDARGLFSRSRRGAHAAGRGMHEPVPVITKLVQTFHKKLVAITKCTAEETKKRHGDHIPDAGWAVSAAAGILLIDTHYEATVRAMLTLRPELPEAEHLVGEATGDSWHFYGPPLKALLSLSTYNDVTATTTEAKVSARTLATRVNSPDARLCSSCPGAPAAR